MIRSATAADAQAICSVYKHFILQSIVTFEETAITADDMAKRNDAGTGQLPFLLVELDGAVAGYAYAALWKTRSAYRHTVESSVYVAPGYAGMGQGSRLYQVLLQNVRERDVHAVLAGIVLPNHASVGLQVSFGFAKVGQMRKVRRKFGQWLDVGYGQLTLAPQR